MTINASKMELKSRYQLFKPPLESWENWVVDYLVSEIEAIKKTKQMCSILLTGGKTAQSVYQEWSKTIIYLEDVNFFMGDERLVPIDHADSNSGMVKKTLFKNGISYKSNFYPLTYPSDKAENFLIEYELKIQKPDIILLGVGDDGHIASIFPENFKLKEFEFGYEIVESENHMHKRVTIKQGNIINCPRVIALAKNKMNIYNLVNSDDKTISRNIPAWIIKDKVWII